MELYYVIAITDRDDAETLNGIYQQTGIPLVLTMLGKGTAKSEHLSIYGLDATEKAVVSAVATGEQARQAFKLAKRKLMIDIPGNGVMMSVPLKSVAGSKTLTYLTENAEIGGKPSMEFAHELIVVILNEGYSDYVMEAARSAGAGGGTVLHAKGTGRAKSETFFGVSLAQEKDVVYIVAHADEKAAIMRAINEQTGPGTKPGAICFSLPISAVAGLREREREDDRRGNGVRPWEEMGRFAVPGCERIGERLSAAGDEPPGEGGASFGNAGAISASSIVPLSDSRSMRWAHNSAFSFPKVR